MKIEELEPIFNTILNKCENLVKNGKRKEILNERFFHHMFSNELSSYFLEKKVDIWDSLLLVPERPTEMKFKWKVVEECFELKDAKRARKEGVGNGRAGQFDFAIFSEHTEPPTFIEFKGPEPYKPIDIVKVMLKLLSEDKSHLKVFVAIITSSSKGEKARIDAENYLSEGVEFALKVLEIKNLKDTNLYVYVATFTDTKPVIIQWGNYLH